MNGPHHYAEGEKLLIGANHPDNHPDWAALSVAMAQAHFTAALVAATVGNQEQDMDLVDEAVRTWDEVLAS